MAEFYYPTLSKTVVDLAFKVHTILGPGLLESCYEACLEHELQKQNLVVQRQVSFPILYDGIVLPNSYQLDLLVEDMLVLELKTLHPLPPVYFKQIRTHLNLLELKFGMLLNFKVELMKDGINRVFNNHGKIRR